MVCELLLAALVQGNLVANGTFDLNATGWALSTPGASYKEGVGRTGGAVHLVSRATESTPLQMVKCSLPTIPRGKALKLTAWVKGSGVKGMVSAAIQAWSEDKTELVDFASTQKSTFLYGTFEWRKVETTLNPGPKAASATILLMLAAEGEAWFDDVSLTVDGESNLSASRDGAPGLFEIRGQTTFIATKDGAEGTALFPLPLDYREQVPLGYHFQAIPSNLVKGQRVYEDRPGNYVLQLDLAPMKTGESVAVDWSSCVLAGPRSGTLPTKGTFPTNWPLEARPWLKSTWSVQSADPRFRAIGKDLRVGGADVPTVVERVIRKAEEVRLNQKGMCTSLDAVQALEKEGSCTSNANLVAALLRSAGVPARILAGYPSWAGPLQTHYNVEAYVPGYGWYLIESTMLRPWTPFGQIQVSIVPTAYEDRGQARSSAAPGVPYLSLTEFTGSSPFTRRGSVDGKAGCDHVCVPITSLEGSPSAWSVALKIARSSWRAWLRDTRDKPRTGPISTGLRAEELKGKTLSDLARRH